ncbi:late secretory pathway protein AVL9 homolog isoform X2 [Acropora muricata]|uniref:late secretory pathway protein AVL9 homolog isoform X2 n=1 Tax=Acropora muricata TaxID=159855 RepID=UPI0034E5AE19
MDLKDPERFILHVCVVGFHHQRGCEVEFTFPPIGKSQDTKLPSEWRFLPFLALPDGAHNCEQDSSYFHLPALSTDNGSQSTVFGVSFFKQIDSKELKNKMDDVTRRTVQKSVCVLSYLPLYGYLKEKIQVATRVYFNEKDFARTEILEQLYRSLNMSVSPSLMEESLLFVGLSAIELLTTFRHRVLVLFKLLLLEKKFMFHGFPVGNLCTQLLSLVSLFPKMLQSGLAYAVPRESNVVTSENS